MKNRLPVTDRMLLDNYNFKFILFLTLNMHERWKKVGVAFYGDRTRRISGSKYPSEDRPSMTVRVGERTRPGAFDVPERDARKTKYVEEVFVKPEPEDGERAFASFFIS